MDRSKIYTDIKGEENVPLLPSYDGDATTALELAAAERFHRKMERRRKFKKAIRFLFAVVLLHFVIKFLFFRGFFGGFKFWKGCHQSNEIYYTEGAGVVDDGKWPIPDYLTLVECADLNGDDDEDPEDPEDFEDGPGRRRERHPHRPPGRGRRGGHPHDEPEEKSVVAAFSLPISSDLLFLISRGPSVGNLTIVESDDLTSADEAFIETTVFYTRDRTLDKVKVCMVEADEGENGLGIFVRNPHYRRRRHHLHLRFDVLVSIPRDSVIKNFQSDMPIFQTNVASLDSVVFDEISLKSAVLAIDVKGINSDNAEIKSGVGAIRGNFNVSRSLELRTANAPINVNVTLFNGEDDELTSVSMHTAHGPIRSNVTLISTAESGKGGNFDISARTAMGPITLGIPEAPVDHSLALTANTAMAPVTLDLHPTYEGSFLLETTMGSTDIDLDDDVEDPSGEGRQRHAEFESVGGPRTRGVVWWGDEKGNGEVNLKTAMGKVTLNL